MTETIGKPGTPENIYTATVYVAAPGTPLRGVDGEIDSTSLAGHIYYSISDGQTDRGYGFSPLKRGVAGPGKIVENEFDEYVQPAYSRTLEITKSQYDALEDFGDSGLLKSNKYFNLWYDGATNSCVDFTWGALNHAGLHKRIELPFGLEYVPKNHDGTLKTLDNIRDFQRIPDPVPGSTHNREQTHPMPKQDGWQRLFSDDDPHGAARDPRHALVAPGEARGPFDDPVLNGMSAALRAGDGKALDDIGRQFASSDEGVRMAQLGEQLHASQHPMAQAHQPEQQAAALARS